METVIEMKNVYFQAQNQEIVHDFSFQFEKGKTIALIGPSGSGKSTVLKLAAGILVPARGDIFFQGHNIFAMNRTQNLSFRKQAAMVFQDSALWSNQSLYQILELPLKLHFPQMDKQERDQRMNDVLVQVGYRKALDVRPAQLSMGEQKLIAFARAMLCDPNLIFLDEWTESLDDASVQRLVNLVWERQRNNDSIIFVSHNYKVIKHLADYIVMIVDGRFSQLFTREQIAQDEDMAQHIEKRIAL
ncbi:MAG: ATP-binding cassette domain-containing protein [Treponema sp.]|jgi:ABC-type glutathione transport system ATPase component|nr:ATP-binding cassette domain-containing protein [Treponema sp.]